MFWRIIGYLLMVGLLTIMALIVVIMILDS